VVVAGVGPRMTEVAGEVADGFMVHPFTTPEFLRTTTWPALERGLALSGPGRTNFEVSLPAMVAVGNDDAGVARAREGFRTRIAFYGSTPAYRIVLDAHGWGDLQPELNRLTKANDWASMPALITDDVLDTFVVSGRVDQIAGRLHERFGGLVDRISVDAPRDVDPQQWREVVEAIRRPPTAP